MGSRAVSMAQKGAHLSRQKREEYMKLFNNLDKDGNGWLSREEVGDWLRGAGYKLSEQKVEVRNRLADRFGWLAFWLVWFYGWSVFCLIGCLALWLADRMDGW